MKFSAWTTRRGIQVALGCLWILDGLLQLQPKMFTSQFATQVILPAGQGQPALVAWPVNMAAHVILHQPLAFDLGFAIIQLLLGICILYPRTTRLALGASVAWALGVWITGEGMGGMFGGGVNLLSGAPGAALLYAVIAMAVWPRSQDDSRALPPERWIVHAWASLWVLGAVLMLLPGQDTSNDMVMSLYMNSQGAPDWLSSLDVYLSNIIPLNSVGFMIDLVVLQLVVGVGALLPRRRLRVAAVILGIILAVVMWVVGQTLAVYWSGLATDPNSGPVIILMGLAVLGSFDRKGAQLPKLGGTNVVARTDR